MVRRQISVFLNCCPVFQMWHPATDPFVDEPTCHLVANLPHGKLTAQAPPDVSRPVGYSYQQYRRCFEHLWPYHEFQTYLPPSTASMHVAGEATALLHVPRVHRSITGLFVGDKSHGAMIQSDEGPERATEHTNVLPVT
jgi:hypothetical protein